MFGKRKRQNVPVQVSDVNPEIQEAKRRRDTLMGRLGRLTEQEDFILRNSDDTESDVVEAARRLGRLEAQLDIIWREP